MRTLFPHTLGVIQKNLELRQARHSLLSSNLANAETPGYVARDVVFEDTLREAAWPDRPEVLHRTHPRHFPPPAPSLPQVQGRLVPTPSDDVGNDLNSVSVDQEMAKLTLNTLHVNASTEFLSRFFDQLRRTISESGR